MPGLFEGFFSNDTERGHARHPGAGVVSLSAISNRSVVVKPKEIGLSVAGFSRRIHRLFHWFGDTAGSIRQLRAAREELAAARARLQDMDQVTRRDPRAAAPECGAEESAGLRPPSARSA